MKAGGFRRGGGNNGKRQEGTGKGHNCGGERSEGPSLMVWCSWNRRVQKDALLEIFNKKALRTLVPSRGPFCSRPASDSPRATAHTLIPAWLHFGSRALVQLEYKYKALNPDYALLCESASDSPALQVPMYWSCVQSGSFLCMSLLYLYSALTSTVCPSLVLLSALGLLLTPPPSICVLVLHPSPLETPSLSTAAGGGMQIILGWMNSQTLPDCCKPLDTVRGGRGQGRRGRGGGGLFHGVGGWEGLLFVSEAQY